MAVQMGTFYARKFTDKYWSTIYRGTIAHTYRIAVSSQGGTVQIRTDGVKYGSALKGSQYVQTIDTCGKKIEVMSASTHACYGKYWKLD